MSRKKLPKTESDELKILGEVMRKQREDRGMTQADVAAHLGRTRETYGKYERGSNEIRIRDLLKFRKLMQEDPLERAFPLIENVSGKGLASPKMRYAESMPRYLLHQKIRIGAAHFEKQRYSPLEKRLNTISRSTFTGASAVACLRQVEIAYDLSFGLPVGGVDWVLLASYALAAILFPFQLAYIARFITWWRFS